MFSRPPSTSNNRDSISSQLSPHPHEVALVLNTITEILAASAQIINRRDEVYPIYLRQPELLTVVAVVPTLERKLMFTYRHVGQSIHPLRISMGRGYVATSIHRPTTSKTFDTIWAVSGYVLLLVHIIVLIVYSVS